MFDHIYLGGITDPLQVHSIKEDCGDDSTEKHILLVTQIQDGVNVPIMCLVALESLSHAYIQYVDTTGLLIPRNKQSQVTKEIIRAYIRQTRVESIQLFSFASKELLFK